MRFRVLFSVILLLAVSACLAADFPAAEVYRIRIENRAGGLVQVSLDQGRTYSAIGRVKVAANARTIGFAASSYIPNGTVAATAVHGIRIKTGQFTEGVVGKAQKPLMFSLIPAEFSEIPKGYGGHIPRSSGIMTHIYSGHAIFRNLSPYVGNRVFTEQNGSLAPLPEDYTPIVGDTLVIVVKRPDRMPIEVDFENRAGGGVTVHYEDRSSEVIAQVDRPVRGVGRYDGTSFTGVGAVNTNHGGVLTISTAPVCPPGSHEGGPVETRGGFMIQPYYHVSEQREGAVQVMVIGPRDKSKPVLEGAPPLFDGFINLADFPARPDCSYRAQVKIDNGDWEKVPKIVGKVNDAFTPAYLKSYFAGLGKSRDVKEGVTAIRLLFPRYDAGLVASDLKRETDAYMARAISSGTKPRGGTICISPKKQLSGIVSFLVDGRAVFSTSSRPCTFAWDSTEYSNGFHTVDIVGEDGAVVESAQVLVRN